MRVGVNVLTLQALTFLVVTLGLGVGHGSSRVWFLLAPLVHTPARHLLALHGLVLPLDGAVRPPLAHQAVAAPQQLEHALLQVRAWGRAKKKH
jgi:hypothetical protein